MKRTRLKPATILRVLNAMPEWRAEHRCNRVFAYWQNECQQHLSGYPVLSLPDDSYIAQVSMRHSQHGNLHLDWYDAIYKVADLERITKEIHRVFEYGRKPLDALVERNFVVKALEAIEEWEEEDGDDLGMSNTTWIEVLKRIREKVSA